MWARMKQYVNSHPLLRRTLRGLGYFVGMVGIISGLVGLLSGGVGLLLAVALPLAFITVIGGLTLLRLTEQPQIQPRIQFFNTNEQDQIARAAKEIQENNPLESAYKKALSGIKQLLQDSDDKNQNAQKILGIASENLTNIIGDLSKLENNSGALHWRGKDWKDDLAALDSSVKVIRLIEDMEELCSNKIDYQILQEPINCTPDSDAPAYVCKELLKTMKVNPYDRQALNDDWYKTHPVDENFKQQIKLFVEKMQALEAELRGYLRHSYSYTTSVTEALRNCCLFKCCSNHTSDNGVNTIELVVASNSSNNNDNSETADPLRISIG
ncbi:MAG: hypothetical protein Tsb005_10080 [Gammaproteobacteria bacterium]